VTTRRWLHAIWLLLACAIGCSLLVDPSTKEQLCAVGESGLPNPCSEGLQCIEGVCRKACNKDVPDICGNNLDDDCDLQVDEQDPEGRDTCGDGIDNDCDGQPDEGSDFDKDGYSRCGRTLNNTIGLPGIDCDDLNAATNPGAVEVCDGKDNDCNGLVDDPHPGTPLCKTGVCFNNRCIVPSCASEGGPMPMCTAAERCDPNTGKCVSKQCADVTCAANEVCDEATKTCKKKQPIGNGSPCVDGVDCASGSCVDAAALRLTTIARVCAQACCDDKQCGKDERCFASGTGARSCLPVRQLPPMAERECTADEACMPNEVCQLSKDKELMAPTFTARTGVITSTCKPNQPNLSEVGDRCTTFGTCASHVCVPALIFGSMCSSACGTSNDCKALAANAYCRYADVTLMANLPVDYAPICVVRRPGETGIGEYGAECQKASDCLDAGCVGATTLKKGRCSGTCCQDSDCGPREDREPLHCRPYAFGTRYEMRCEI
jgi:hypothetical protein